MEKSRKKKKNEKKISIKSGNQLSNEEIQFLNDLVESERIEEEMKEDERLMQQITFFFDKTELEDNSIDLISVEQQLNQNIIDKNEKISSFWKDVHTCKMLKSLAISGSSADYLIVGITEGGLIPFYKYNDGIDPEIAFDSIYSLLGYQWREWDDVDCTLVEWGTWQNQVDAMYYDRNHKRYIAQDTILQYFTENTIQWVIDWWDEGRKNNYTNKHIGQPIKYILNIEDEKESDIEITKPKELNKYEKFLKSYSGFMNIEGFYMTFYDELSYHIPNNYRVDQRATDYLVNKIPRYRGKYICIYKDVHFIEIPFLTDALQTKWLYPRKPFVAYAQNENPAIKETNEDDLYRLTGSKADLFMDFSSPDLIFQKYKFIRNETEFRSIFEDNYERALTYLNQNPYFEDWKKKMWDLPDIREV